MKYFGDEKGKSQPKGSTGANVQSGLSMQSKFDADDVRSAGPEKDMEQARCARKMEKVAGGFVFDGNSGS